MMKWIGKFAASKVSGYTLIALLLAAGGSAIWFWNEIKEFGSLSEKADQQARKIKSLENEALYQQARADERTEIGARLSEKVAKIETTYRSLSISFAEELRNAPQDYIDCRNMLVPGGLRHPDAKGGIQDDQAGSSVDG